LTIYQRIFVYDQVNECANINAIATVALRRQTIGRTITVRLVRDGNQLEKKLAQNKSSVISVGGF
jgi:hypothetical protein